MMIRLSRLFIFALVVLSVRAALGDTILLKDGSSVVGDLKRDPDGNGWIITTPDGKSRNIPNDAVRSVQLGASPSSTSPVVAAESLASLRRSVEAVSDINQIISRYQRFISSNTDAQSLAEARSDLEQWQKRKDAGLIKHGNQWVSPEAVRKLQDQATTLAVQAREQIRQNRLRDAETTIQQALTIDPQNASANYLRGVMLFRQDKIADARKAFDASNSALPNHPPTLNNLAVTLWRQNQPAVAMNYYDQAMQSSGANEYILNNVAEALGVLPEEQRKGTAVTRALKRFTEQDLILQKQMAQQGLYRWGGGWIDQKQFDTLKAAEKEVRQKLDALQQEFDQGNATAQQLSQTISRNEASMDELRRRSVYRDSTGRYITMALPSAYYDLDRQNQALKVEQDALGARLRAMPDVVNKLKLDLPSPKFTGVQQIVGVEGMPAPIDPPTSRPASQ